MTSPMIAVEDRVRHRLHGLRNQMQESRNRGWRAHPPRVGLTAAIEFLLDFHDENIDKSPYKNTKVDIID